MQSPAKKQKYSEYKEGAIKGVELGQQIISEWLLQKVGCGSYIFVFKQQRIKNNEVLVFCSTKLRKFETEKTWKSNSFIEP